MTRAMYMSKLYAPTLKEDPADAELASHRLLLRAGMIRKEAAGLYSYLPLAWRSIRKIENIVRRDGRCRRPGAYDAYHGRRRVVARVRPHRRLWQGACAL